MCGIVGICNLGARARVEEGVVRRMMGMIRYRGPDETGMYIDDTVGLGHVRLSIVDLESGCQPLHNEDETLWIVYNGEIFNYIELRQELAARGHRFYTTTDTEVLLHLYEEEGPHCLDRLNGQFALAIWNRRDEELFMARDRVGIRPLHYTVHGGQLVFASEIKAILAVPGVPREMDPVALDQIFTVWTTLDHRTAFRDIHEVLPGHYVRVSHGVIREEKYWDLPICGRQQLSVSPPDVLCEEMRSLLLDAIRLRLRADVPVGCYLSGGLDASGIAATVSRRFDARLRTFGIRFDQEAFDEGPHQAAMVSFLGTNHQEVLATAERIGASFAETLWHCEKPLLRTAPVPLYLLSEAVRQSGLKVVLTGEGADEVFGGYDIFKEAKIRRFWARRPDSPARAALCAELYNDVFRDPRVRPFLAGFFGRNLGDPDDPFFSHALRWENTHRIKIFFSDEINAAIGTTDPYEVIRHSLPERYRDLDALGRAQYLEMRMFLSNYLLSSQGDRVAMAHSVEVRLPYLDYRIIEFMSRVPSRWKLLGLNEKHILKKVLEPVLPKEIVGRRKQPYRAPIVPCLLHGRSREGAMDLMSGEAIRRAGLFNADRVSRLLHKLQVVRYPGEVDGMALAGVLSAQIIHQQFISDFSARGAPDLHPDLIIDRRTGAKCAQPRRHGSFDPRVLQA